jgi:dipeptidyl aminopeptidase/acylaminoacyl peptidase
MASCLPATTHCNNTAARGGFMRGLTLRGLRAQVLWWGALTALVLQTASAAAQTPAISSGKPPSVEDFFRLPRMQRPVVSPDGRFIAISVASERGRLQLGVIDIEKPTELKVVAGFVDGDVAAYYWVNPERLVLTVTDTQQADRPIGPGLFAVNRNGTEWRELITTGSYSGTPTGTHIKSRVLPWQWGLLSTLRDGSADVIIEAPVWDNKWELITVNLARLNTTNGASTNLSEGAPADIERWSVDQRGRPIAVRTGAGSRQISYLNTDKGWSRWQDTNRFEELSLDPVALDTDGSLLVIGRGMSNHKALYRFDPATRKLAEQPVVSIAGYDADVGVVYDSDGKRVLGLRYESDAEGSVWLDADMQQLQAEIDKKLPSTVNRIDCGGRCGSAATVLVTTYSDQSPPAYLLYRRSSKEFALLGSSRPWIQPKQMAQRDVFRFNARDGLSIPVLVTRPDPKASAPKPAVVLVHGGPNVRGTHWGWEPDAQFLASRGYIVIEPEFRGSTGYGYELFRAGWKQWGLAMQDDIADAVKWAVQQGWVDPRRVCIGGASYGGYATLMGLIKDPELYQCGFEWIGVTDINLLYSIHWSDTSDAWKSFGMPVLIGDPVADAKQFEATSPLKQVARLQRPLLMAYGAIDYRVPIKHGQEFKDAVTRTNKNVEWVVYPDEGHGWRELKTNVDFWTRVERFLARHLGDEGTQAQAADSVPKPVASNPP